MRCFQAGKQRGVKDSLRWLGAVGVGVGAKSVPFCEIESRVSSRGSLDARVFPTAQGCPQNVDRVELKFPNSETTLKEI